MMVTRRGCLPLLQHKAQKGGMKMAEALKNPKFEDLPFPDSDSDEALEKYMPVYREYHRQLMSRHLDQVWEKIYHRPEFNYPDDLMESKVKDCLEKLDDIILASFMYGAKWVFDLMDKPLLEDGGIVNV